MISKVPGGEHLINSNCCYYREIWGGGECLISKRIGYKLVIHRAIAPQENSPAGLLVLWLLS